MQKYIGISGITNLQELIAIQSLWGSANISEYDLFLGFLINAEDILTKQKPKNPRNLNLNDSTSLFQLFALNQPGIKNIMHIYCKNPSHIYQSVNAFLSEYLKDDYYIHGIQINAELPPNSQIKQIRDEWNLIFILQLNEVNFEKVDQIDLGLYDYILIDFSRGKGIITDLTRYEKIIRQITAINQITSIAIAGGISPFTIYHYRCNFLNCSFDAESKLRNNHDQIDMGLIRQYLQNTGKKAQRPY